MFRSHDHVPFLVLAVAVAGLGTVFFLLPSPLTKFL